MRKVEPRRDLLNAANRKIRRLLYPPDERRLPATRGECKGGARPCPFVSCRHNLYLDETKSGGLKINFDCEPWEVPPELSCSLDIADAGWHTMDEIAEVFGVKRQRIEQVIAAALHSCDGVADSDALESEIMATGRRAPRPGAE